MATNEPRKASVKLPRVEYRRIRDNKRQIRILTYQPGEEKPFETIADVIPLRKRAPAGHTASEGS